MAFPRTGHLVLLIGDHSDVLGLVTTIAGDGNAGFANGPGDKAEFYGPYGIAFASSGNNNIKNKRLGFCSCYTHGFSFPHRPDLLREGWVFATILAQIIVWNSLPQLFLYRHPGNSFL